MYDINEDIEILWNYLCIGTEPIKSDCIIGLGSILTLIPKRCADIYNQGLADYIVFSGNCGKGTKGIISITEAERFKKIAIEEGVVEDRIITESRATTTYENIYYINEILKSRDLNPNTIMIVGKPYQERRAKAIADMYLAGKNYRVVSLNMTLQEYLDFAEKDELMIVEDAINEMIGEISLMIKAPRYGLQSVQEIPNEVLDSYNKMVALGYNKYFYSDSDVYSIAQNFAQNKENFKKKKDIERESFIYKGGNKNGRTN